MVWRAIEQVIIVRHRAIRRRAVDLELEAEVCEMRRRGFGQGAISVEVGVSQGTVSLILGRHGLGGWLRKVEDGAARREGEG
jgi:hypothetical protein